MPDSASQPEAEGSDAETLLILSPRDGDACTYQCTLKGGFRVHDRTRQYRIVVQQHNDPRYYPQGSTVEFDDADRTFNAMTHFGMEGPRLGVRFDILIVSTTNAAEHEFVEYLFNVERLGWYGMTELPEGTRKEAIVRNVVRQ